MHRLKSLLHAIDGRGYPQYKRLRGSYEFPNFRLNIEHVQGDPFAAPSHLSVELPTEPLQIPQKTVQQSPRRVGAEDAILRSWSNALRNQKSTKRGSGKSGLWHVVKQGQEILPRTACEMDSQRIILRFSAGLPAAGRRILSRQAYEMFFEQIPEAISMGIIEADHKKWERFADASEDQQWLRNILKGKGWVAFIGNQSLLPRTSGVSDKPLEQGIPWQSPESLMAEVNLPNAGNVVGSAIPEGITLICGGGYHGKSTLLQALARGIYDHIPGDGREYVVTSYDAVSIRAEDGRAITKVDISPFIGKLPNGEDTKTFSTHNASGSTSQATNIVEAIELGSDCLLIDEDTSATNFMVRDRRMQELIKTQDEPITPLIDRIKEIYNKYKISTICVIGGSGDYFEVAHHILVMQNYLPKIVTEKAKSISEAFPAQRLKEDHTPIELKLQRVPLPESFDPSSGKRQERVRTQQTKQIQFGRFEIDISLLNQLVDEGQTKTLGDWLIQISRDRDVGEKSIGEICVAIENKAKQGVFSKTCPKADGHRVFARRFELAATINRLRSLVIDEN